MGKWIGAPRMKPHRLHAAGEVAAEQVDQLGDGEVEERPLATRFELGRERPPEIGLDLWPPEGPEVIRARPRAVGAAEYAAVLVELLRI